MTGIPPFEPVCPAISMRLDEIPCNGKLLGFLASQPPCTVAMESCAGAHYWGREIAVLGHQVRLVPPIYVKPFVKRKSSTGQAAARADR
ncbi:MAG: transposase [Gemmatimonadetes bacterium]|nr:transposase [Gemmatimonadota bacterium]